ncbi:OmpA family protein [Nocardiopsis potens]|uniref:OmpA family protein n=1 Tax=Nocardiopsis potens TaxID=1246458 RepID=UPI001F4CDCD7|nr:OmpA family protein [Nocardiopsis potens]
MHRPLAKSTKKHRIASTTSLLAVSLLLTSCVSDGGASNEGGKNDTSGNGGGSSDSEGKNTPIATSLTSATPNKEKLEFGVMSLERHGEDIVVLNVTVTNLGEQEATVRDMFNDGRFSSNYYTPDGISLIDTKNNQRYMPLLRKDEDHCLCSDWKDTSKIAQDEAIDFWVSYPAPPSDVKSVAITTPVTPDMIDIPITNAESPDKEIIKSPVGEPDIRDLTSFADSLEDDTSRADSGSETRIMLSSDVLFEVEESELTEKADQALKDVAKEIDQSSGSTVQIDGYTDNTGNDSINEPLSEDRAKAVEEKLKKLVTKEGVTFETAGHGSSDPVATNNTEEGKAKNRRVTISFEK